jgi:hypothetical protein
LFRHQPLVKAISTGYRRPRGTRQRRRAGVDVIDDGLDFEHNVADGELIGSPPSKPSNS